MLPVGLVDKYARWDIQAELAPWLGSQLITDAFTEADYRYY